jgi:hypothetical protein
MKTKRKFVAVALMTGVALVGLLSCQRQQESALEPIEMAALQTMVDTTAKELRTPQVESTVSYGTTLLGAITPPGADIHFRIASIPRR